ncbi:MAG: hypothetical protein ACFB10_07845 [Salibacteraceae bacterium]
MKHFQIALTWVTLFFAFVPTLLSAQIGRQSYEAIRELKEDKKLFVVVGNGKKSHVKPGSFYAEYRAAFENEWNFCKFEVITWSEAGKLGKDTNLYFLRLSPDMKSEPRGAVAMLTKGYKSAWISPMLSKMERQAIVQYSTDFVKKFKPEKCNGQFCMVPTFRFLVKCVQSYLQTAYDIEDGRFEAVAWANREKLKNATWYLHKRSLAGTLRMNDTFAKVCPIDHQYHDFMNREVRQDLNGLKEEEVVFVQFAYVDRTTGHWDRNLVSLSGDLLFHIPFKKGDRLMIPFPNINDAFMEALKEWLEKDALDE